MNDDTLGSKAGFEAKGSKWTDLRRLGNSKIVKSTVLIPLIGYLILFNEDIVAAAQMSDDLVGRSILLNVLFDVVTPAMEVSYRLYFIYFGLTSIAVGSILFQLFCPHLIKLYETHAVYVEQEERVTTDSMEGKIRQRILSNEFHHSLFDKFEVNSSKLFQIYESTARENLKKPPNKALLNSFQNLTDGILAKFSGDTEKSDALALMVAEFQYRHGDLFRGGKANVMAEEYIPHVTSRYWLRHFVWAFYIGGTGLIFIPAADTFLAVIRTIVE